MLPILMQNPSWRVDKVSAVFRISCDHCSFFLPCTFPICLDEYWVSRLQQCQRQFTMPSVKNVLVGVLCLLVCFAERFVTARLWH